MQKIVGIRFKPTGKIYFFDPLQIFLKPGDNVIVETARGMEFGTVVSKVDTVDDQMLKHPIKPVIRKASAKDVKLHLANLAKTPQALSLCRAQVEKRGLKMKVIKAEYTFDSSKVIFSFTADGRIDFRELVKDLASIFRIRIELRQVGVRDESKMLGGIGQCGRELCCSKWLSEFQPVSIKMAKEQGLSLNPGKISGICGRLLCCLQYEHAHYEDTLNRLPEPGTRVKTPDGEGIVQKVNAIKENLTVRMVGEEDSPIRDYSAEDVKAVGGRRRSRGKGSDVEINEQGLSADELAELKALAKSKMESSDGE